MLQIHRLRDPGSPLFAPAMALYAASFPAHEQRMGPSQRRIMAHEQYHFGLLMQGDDLVGLALYWDAGAFLYVEHLCIAPQMRGRGLGERALARLTAEGKPVILEIDPPVDDISRRRRVFYKRFGFCANPHAHVHPPYRPDNGGHALVVMSHPRPLTHAQYAAFAAYLGDVVMRDCQTP